MITMPQLLLIAGTGQNTGKTTLACRIIEKFSASHPVVALKISPHFHKNVHSGIVHLNKPYLYLAEEVDPETGKDSSRMLEAGAVKSFFAMTTDEFLPETLEQVLEHIPSGSLLVCESGGLRNFVVPGLFLMMNNRGTEVVKPKSERLLRLADRIISFDGEKYDFDIASIEVKDNQWKIKD